MENHQAFRTPLVTDPGEFYNVADELNYRFVRGQGLSKT